MERRPRVLQIFNRYLEYGGEQASVFRIGDTLQEKADVEYFTTSSDELLASRNPVDMASAAVSAMHNATAVRRLTRYQKIGRFDLWLVHNIFPAMSPSVYALAFKLGVPVLQYLHNYRMSCVNGLFLNHGEACTSCIQGNFTKAALTGCWRDSRLISGWMGAVMTRVRAMGVFDKVTAWIALSVAQKEMHVRMGIQSGRIHVLPHFFEPRAELFIPETGQDVIFLGRLSKEKGVEQLLDAWKLVQRGSAKLVIAGEGPEKQKLESKVTSEGIGGVEFLGFVTREQQAELWRRAAFSVVPSIWQEPLGLVAFEAWERGRPVVVSDTGGLAESVGEGVGGVKVPMRDARAWARAISQLLGDPGQRDRMARAGLEKLRRDYAKDIWLERICAIFGLVLAANPAAKMKEIS